MKAWQRKAISKILNDFDFEQINRYMIELKWTYGAEKTSPSIKELKKVAKELLMHAIDSENNEMCKDDNVYFVSSGGLRAIYFKDTAIDLSFYLSGLPIWKKDV